MLKDVIGKYYFEGNYNCAETIIRAGNDYYGLGLHEEDMKMLGVYGAGIQCGNTCKDIKPQSFKPEYRCLKTIETACDILEETIAEYEASKS